MDGILFRYFTSIYVVGYVTLAISFKRVVDIDPALVALGITMAVELSGVFQFMVKTSADI